MKPIRSGADREENRSLFPGVARSVLVIGTSPNSTYDYYIAPRLSPDARAKTVRIDPWRERIGDKAPPPLGCAVIVNRYITPGTLFWIERHRRKLAAVFWVLDDDLGAMVRDASVPLAIKARPALTLALSPFLKSLCDRIFLSSEGLKRHFANAATTVIPPLADLSKIAEKPFERGLLRYFGKMHGPEHAFLYPLIEEILHANSNLRFEVIANGRWGRRWSGLPRVTVFEEVPYADYPAFLDALPAGGLFLAPLSRSRLNESRSSAKLIEIARSNSAAILADHRAYKADVHLESVPFCPPGRAAWRTAIEAALNDPRALEENRRAVRAALEKNWNERRFIL